MSYIVRTRHVTKSFQGKDVVSDVSMNIRKGEIYGFLGPNGAGKTTLMKMITNLVKPSSGEIEIFGQKLANSSFDILKRMGSIIEYPVFYDKLTALENLELHCEYMGHTDKRAIHEALELVNLQYIDRKAVQHFSLGMKQRLGIARAMITKPELLILDEPINGLDPMGIKEMRDIFKTLSERYGITLLISSHILGEIEQIADTVGVITGGKLVEEVSMDTIRQRNTDYIELVTSDCRKASHVLEHTLRHFDYKAVDGRTIRIYKPNLVPSDILRALVMEGVDIDSFSKQTGSLEHYFIELIQGGHVYA